MSVTRRAGHAGTHTLSEAEIGKSRVQDHLCLYSELEDSLGHVRRPVSDKESRDSSHYPGRPVFRGSGKPLERVLTLPYALCHRLKRLTNGLYFWSPWETFPP